MSLCQHRPQLFTRAVELAAGHLPIERLREIVVLSDATGSHYLRVTVSTASEADQAILRELDGVPVVVVQKP